MPTYVKSVYLLVVRVDQFSCKGWQHWRAAIAHSETQRQTRRTHFLFEYFCILKANRIQLNSPLHFI